MSSRRDFLVRSAAASGALGLGLVPTLARAAMPDEAVPATRRPTDDRAPTPLSILILGGTGFTGPNQVNYATARGHKVTILHRGKTRPGMFRDRVEELTGDLNDDVSALRGRKFDVVIDNPTTLPFWVRNAAQYLKGNTKHYIFISTISVYPDNSVPNADETAPTTPLPAGLDPYTVKPQDAGRLYGALKSEAEREVQRQYPGIFTIVRPGLIVGPDDRSDRFTYWPVRVDRGGEVMAPGTPNDPVQYIDARDLAEWMIRMAELGPANGAGGIYNATGPRTPLTQAEFMYGLKAVTSSNPRFTWVPADFLAEQKIRPWRDMPVWIPPTGDTAGFMLRNTDRALAKGLTFRPLAVTARDTIDWNATRPEEDRKKLEAGAVAGISAEHEAQVLAAWRARKA